MNLNGRICAEGLLVFGIGGLAVTYVIAPVVDNLVGRVSEKFLKMVCIAVMAVFFWIWFIRRYIRIQAKR